jgi:hypothetical protein
MYEGPIRRRRNSQSSGVKIEQSGKDLHFAASKYPVERAYQISSVYQNVKDHNVKLFKLF